MKQVISINLSNFRLNILMQFQHATSKQKKWFKTNNC